MRGIGFGRAVVTGIAAFMLIPDCRGNEISFASISGLCIPASSATSLGGPASVSAPSTACPPPQVGVVNYDYERGSALASDGLLQIMGEGTDSGYDTGVNALASYTQEVLVIGPDSGSGTLYLLFATRLNDDGDGEGTLHGQFAPSVGTGGIVFHCGGNGLDCPVEPTTIEFALPFTYGVPFAYTISLSNGGESEESLIFNDSALLTSMQAGPLDTIEFVPEPRSLGLMLIGLTILVTMKRPAVTESLKAFAMGKKST